jgi:cytochrome c5
MDDMLKGMLFVALIVTIWQWGYIKNKINAMIKTTPSDTTSSSTKGATSSTSSTSTSGPASSFGTRSRYTKPTIPLSARPFDRNVVSRACSSCASGASCSCPGVGDRAQTLIQQQKNRNVMNKVGGNALKAKIRQGNRLPANVVKAHMASNATTQGVTTDDPGDFSEYMKNNSITCILIR